MARGHVTRPCHRRKEASPPIQFERRCEKRLRSGTLAANGGRRHRGSSGGRRESLRAAGIPMRELSELTGLHRQSLYELLAKHGGESSSASP